MADTFYYKVCLVSSASPVIIPVQIHLYLTLFTGLSHVQSDEIIQIYGSMEGGDLGVILETYPL